MFLETGVTGTTIFLLKGQSWRSLGRKRQKAHEDELQLSIGHCGFEQFQWPGTEDILVSLRQRRIVTCPC